MDIKRIGECSEHDEGAAECGPFASLRFLIRTPLRANNQLRIPGLLGWCRLSPQWALRKR